MKNLFKISIIAIILLFFSISYVYAIDMFLNEDNNTEEKTNETTIKVEDESYEENYVEEEILTTRK